LNTTLLYYLSGINNSTIEDLTLGKEEEKGALY